MMLNLLVFLAILNSARSASEATTIGTYEVINKTTKIPCIRFLADIYLYLTYETMDGEQDATVHVPTSSTIDTDKSSCEHQTFTSGLLMDNWSIDFAFTKDKRFGTDKEKEFTLFQVNVTANFASDPTTFPNSKYPTQQYSVHVDSDDLSDIAGSVYATLGNSYYCPSEQKYVINDDSQYGPTAYIKLKLVTLQAFMSSAEFGTRETCPTDQQTTDLIPIIVGSSLAGLIIITLVVYLIYRSFLPEEIINLVNPDSHFNLNKDVNINTDDFDTTFCHKL